MCRICSSCGAERFDAPRISIDPAMRSLCPSCVRESANAVRMMDVVSAAEQIGRIVNAVGCACRVLGNVISMAFVAARSANEAFEATSRIATCRSESAA